ncbi:hypothetical protein B0A55_01474 [Friedmanniomyces simplex]|uniref:Uncharacterized protein n=1 Tax=Friedmanniomyces simplex TaxID=329884 RepID=A0A4U0XXY2_9PEZI|nr:hypothetical protein B0A55_01474 [Friedmanniomyces simplex]
MDISAALASEPQRAVHHDLLGLAPSPEKAEEEEGEREEQRRNPFNMSRQSSSQDLGRMDPVPVSPSTKVSSLAFHRRDRDGAGGGGEGYDYGGHDYGGYDYGGHDDRDDDDGDDNDDDDDDGNGDLGFAAAAAGGQGRTGRGRGTGRRKVIVERLEMVGSRRPVFEWC